MNIISIDIGEKNFAFSFIRIIKEATECIFEVEDVHLHDVVEKSKQTIIESCCKISNILQAHDNKISTCSFILIEQQMRPNIRAQRIAQHVWSYLHTKYVIGEKPEEHPKIISISSTLKTKVFTNEVLSKHERKKWVTDSVLTKNIIILAKVHGIATIIPDRVLTKIQEFIKQDDVCDTIVQALVFLIKNSSLTKTSRSRSRAEPNIQKLTC